MVHVIERSLSNFEGGSSRYRPVRISWAKPHVLYTCLLLLLLRTATYVTLAP